MLETRNFNFYTCERLGLGLTGKFGNFDKVPNSREQLRAAATDTLCGAKLATLTKLLARSPTDYHRPQQSRTSISSFIIASSHEIMCPSSSIKKRKIQEERDIMELMEIVVLAQAVTRRLPPAPPLRRYRWNSSYLRDLAAREGSFVAEYRMTPIQFDTLCDMLGPSLHWDEKMAAVCEKKTQSSAIGVDSIVGQALIRLAGGRCIESMRTHGVSETTAYRSLQRFVDAVNTCDLLAMDTAYSMHTLQVRANEFKQLSTHHLFDFCVGAVDGLAIQVIAPSEIRGGGLNARRYYSGSKKQYCVNLQAVCDANCWCSNHGTAHNVIHLRHHCCLFLVQ